MQEACIACDMPEMQNSSAPIPTTAKRTLQLRILLFLVGAVVNYLLIATPLQWLEANAKNLPGYLRAGISVGVSSSFFFFWNYFVNFRTDSRKRDAFGRYVATVAILWALSTSILTMFKSFDANMAFALLGKQIDLDVIATQACFGWLKFIIYHKWAFPVAREAETVTAAVPPADDRT